MSIAVASGLQRNFTGEFLDQIQEMRKSADRKPPLTLSPSFPMVPLIHADNSAAVLRDYDGRPYHMPPFTGASEGASTLITAMVDPTIEDASGAFLSRNAVADEQLTSWILNRENWAKLWELSEKLIGEHFSI